MSYILEALKKAQAERQLGSAPTLDALPVSPPPAPATAARRALPAAAIGVGVIALVAAASWWWWARSPAPAPAPAVVAAPAPAVSTPPVPTPAPALAVTPPSSPPLAVAPPTSPPREVVKPAPVKAPAAAAPLEARLPTLRELPESVRASIPQVSFGGYMYSANPADRLLLVDKVLRHEGEEVAPGLVLEKLLPKAAQMNYRGTRYQVPY